MKTVNLAIAVADLHIGKAQLKQAPRPISLTAHTGPTRPIECAFSVDFIRKKKKIIKEEKKKKK